MVDSFNMDADSTETASKRRKLDHEKEEMDDEGQMNDELDVKALAQNEDLNGAEHHLDNCNEQSVGTNENFIIEPNQGVHSGTVLSSQYGVVKKILSFLPHIQLTNCQKVGSRYLGHVLETG